MLSTFSGIEIGKKGLLANNMGIETTGHNLSNIDTEGYSRQKVNLKAFDPIYEPDADRVETPGQIGQGVVVEDIERVRDQAIDDRINNENGGLGFWSTKKQFLKQIETILNEPGNSNIRTALDQYWEAWQKVASDPTERASREELLQRSGTLTSAFRHNFNSLYDLRKNADGMVSQKVNEINNMAKEIAILNVQISKSEAMNDRPNDLYDRRDLLIDRLSKDIDINVERNNKKEVIIYAGAENLVQGGKANLLKEAGNSKNDGFVDIFWDDGRVLKPGTGELAGLTSARDEDIRDAINNIDSLAQNIIDSTNEIHRDGFGLDLSTNNNFFRENPLSPNSNGNYDFNNTGNQNGTAVFKISGIEKLTPDTVVGSAGTMNFGAVQPNGVDITVSYNSNDKVKDIIDRINKSYSPVVAYLNQRGEFSLKARFPENGSFPEFVIRHIEDSGNFLTGITGMLSNSGAQGAFDYGKTDAVSVLKTPAFNVSLSPEKHPSVWMEISEKILLNPDSIAAAGAIDTSGSGKPDRINGTGDNTNALAIADLRNKEVMIERQSTFADFNKSVIGDFGTRSENAGTNYDKDDAVVTSLDNLRKQVSGVNVDEEMTKMIMYQHGYSAAARLVTTMDDMIQTVIKMGA